jgi:hypothetical protein
MSYTAALTPGEGGWICAETAEAPEAIRQGRMLEEAKANVAEALGERAQVTVTPVAAVAGSERPRRLALTPRPMGSASPPCGRQRTMEGGRRARESRICRENTSRGERPEVLDSTTDGPQTGARPKRRGRLVDAGYTTRDARLTQ